jgi:hypothetical protein
MKIIIHSIANASSFRDPFGVVQEKLERCLTPYTFPTNVTVLVEP